MSLTVNGTLIPENIAGNLKFNAIDITKVFMNGLQVWAQSLFNAVWSGDTIGVSSAVLKTGFNVSGNTYRVYNLRTSVYGGPWVTVNLDGNFTSHADVVGTYGILWAGADSGGGANGTMSNGLKTGLTDSTSVVWNADQVVFTKGVGFSGVSTIAAGHTTGFGLETSTGLLRAVYRYNSIDNYGAWVSLT